MIKNLPTIHHFVKMTSVVQKFDNLLETGLNNYETGTFVSKEEELKNMKELCELAKQFESSTHVLDRIGHLFEFPIPEIIDLSFYMLNKFTNNPFLQIQFVIMIRTILCDNDICIPKVYYDKFNQTIMSSLKIVHTSFDLDDTDDNENEMISRYVEDAIVILTLFQLDRNTIDVEVLKKMYSKYNRNIFEVKLMYDGLMM